MNTYILQCATILVVMWNMLFVANAAEDTSLTELSVGGSQLTAAKLFGDVAYGFMYTWNVRLVSSFRQEWNAFQVSDEPRDYQNVSEQVAGESLDTPWAGVFVLLVDNTPVLARNFGVQVGARYFTLELTEHIKPYFLGLLGYRQVTYTGCQSLQDLNAQESCVVYFVALDVDVGLQVAITSRVFVYLENRIARLVPYYQVRYEHGEKTRKMFIQTSVFGQTEYSLTKSLQLGVGIKI